MCNKAKPIGKSDKITELREGTTVELTSRATPPSTPKQPTGNK